MKANIQTRLNALCDSIINLHEASEDYNDELKKFAPIYNQATPSEQVEIRNTVAKLVGTLYKVKPIMLNTGTLGFERTSAASKALRRLLPVKKPVDNVSTKTTRKSVDPVQSTAKRIGKNFSKTEIKRLIKELTQIAK